MVPNLSSRLLEHLLGGLDSRHAALGCGSLTRVNSESVPTYSCAVISGLNHHIIISCFVLVAAVKICNIWPYEYPPFGFIGPSDISEMLFQYIFVWMKIGKGLTVL